MCRDDEAFWRTKNLGEMGHEEWESLCDGCGQCCAHKLEDEDSGRVYFTDVACRLLDMESCRCMDYTHRQLEVPDCIRLSVDEIDRTRWLPESCAYRLVARGEDLPFWHPLVSGDIQSVHEAGISVRRRLVPECEAGDLEDHVVGEGWLKAEPPGPSAMRLDKWLWAARLFKTRKLAAEAIQGGKVHVGGDRVKAARRIRIGEVLKVTRGQSCMTLVIHGLNERRRPASEAQALYRETDESRATNLREAQALRIGRRQDSTVAVSRPNRQQRRELRRFLGKG